MYLKNGRIKCEIALAKNRDLRREAERAKSDEAEARDAIRASKMQSSYGREWVTQKVGTAHRRRTAAEVEAMRSLLIWKSPTTARNWRSRYRLCTTPGRNHRKASNSRCSTASMVTKHAGGDRRRQNPAFDPASLQQDRRGRAGTFPQKPKRIQSPSHCTAPGKTPDILRRQPSAVSGLGSGLPENRQRGQTNPRLSPQSPSPRPTPIQALRSN